VLSGLRRFVKTFFGRAVDSGLQESEDALRRMFKARYWSFKSLLNANHRALEIMSHMEHALRGSQSFGMGFVRANCTAVSVNVFKIIRHMNELADNRYAALCEVFEKIGDNIAVILDEQKQIGQGQWTLPLEAVNKEMADQVGSKMANLGEIRNRVRLPVPEGFVITASAYQGFLEYNSLQVEINRRIQPLNLEDLETLHEASADIQQLIIRSPLPDELERRILSEYKRLEERTRQNVNVSMRSSCVGEDTERTSFAGQYASKLNVSSGFLCHTYKEILASKYSPQAITYRLNMGFRDEDVVMCVGVMTMVDAVSSGVMYSRDPGNIRNDVVVINAVWGLAKSVVDGTVSPDLFVVSKEAPGRILKEEIRGKEHKVVCFAEEGVCSMVVAGEEKDQPSMTPEQVLKAATLACRLEAYYGSPQDIEWSIEPNGTLTVLQSRPLRQLDTATEQAIAGPRQDTGATVILHGGLTACPGVVSGPAFQVTSMVEALQFPSGAVLVAHHALPQWAALLNRAAGVITDLGGITGHLATVSREFGVPALFNTGEATARIQNGMVVTVDADGRRVYEGRIASLLETASAEKRSLMKGSPVYNILEKVDEHILPLNLTDPDGNNFRPSGCKTYHDITRFCHEKAVKEMFGFGKDHHFPERSSKQLVCHVPMQWWVIDLEDGFKEPVEGTKVELENIASVPMRALWEGITAFPWQGPPPVDAKGFLSVMFRSTMDPSLAVGGRSRYAEKNYFMISKNFCNLSSRLGYHLSTIEAFLGENPRENYVSFNFKGGGADLNRRVLRLQFIEQILKKFDFRVEITEDSMIARLEGYDRNFMLERLKVLGYVSVHTRQLDMVMADDATVNHYMQQHLKDISTFVSL
jgi:pyruvate,water dikinase